MNVFTTRLVLHPVDESEARRISDRAPAPEGRWAVDYPFDGDLAGLRAYLHAERDGMNAARRALDASRAVVYREVLRRRHPGRPRPRLTPSSLGCSD